MFADDGYVSLHLLGFLLLVAFLIHVALLGWIFVKVRRRGWGVTRSERWQRVALFVSGSILCASLAITAFYLLRHFL